MQVALKEEPAPKPKADAKAMSRRVSFAPEATLQWVYSITALLFTVSNAVFLVRSILITLTTARQ